MYSPPSLLLSDLTTKELEEEYFLSKYRKIDYALRSGTSCFADLVERTVDDIDAMTVGGFRAYYRVAPAVRIASASVSASASALPSAEQVAAQRLAKRLAKEATKQARWRLQAFADICEILEREKDHTPCTAERVAALLNDKKECDDELIGMVVGFVEGKGWVSSQETPAEETPGEPTSAEEISTEEIPVEPTSAVETPVETTPVNETPAEEIPADETSAEELPTTLLSVFTHVVSESPASESTEESSATPSADLQIVLQELPLQYPRAQVPESRALLPGSMNQGALQIGLSLEEWPALPEPATPIRLTLQLHLQLQKVPLQKVSQKIQKQKRQRQRQQRRIPKGLPTLSLPALQLPLHIHIRPLF